MARKHKPFLPDHPTETELWVVEQELRARLTVIQISLAPTERARPIQIQLSPISFLPNEVLIHIFQHGLNEVSHSPYMLPLPIVMAGVCRSWRAAVFRTPELWTRVLLTSATPIGRLQTYLEKSGNFEIDVSFCHWPVHKRAHEVNSSEAFLESMVGTLYRHAHRLQSLSLWDVSDTVVCTVMKGLLNFHAPRLTSVSVKANHTAYTHYYQLRDLYLLPFLGGRAPSLTRLDIDHFPIETFRMRSDWPFDVQNLTSLTLRTQECPTLGFFLPPYLIEFPALCALLRSTPNLITLALYGPIIEPDEDFPVRPPGVTLSSLETLIIHRRDPGVRYHCELLSVLTAPTLKHLEIPWHDDLTVELPYANRTAEYLFDEEGQPRFASVKEVYLHDSAAKWKMPTRSFMNAFPNVEEVILGGTDVARFAATLRGFVRPHPVPLPVLFVLVAASPGTRSRRVCWQTVRGRR
ncbi:hypothetical protein J3R83DRAFT_12478 [Lanmaoa asiatica]|nr:hypothetical protein J3R83DRAFT_12478 [Lanmaoa asiatica]